MSELEYKFCRHLCIYLPMLSREEVFDFRNNKQEGNTGFYFVRSNNRTVKLWEDSYRMSMRY